MRVIPIIVMAAAGGVALGAGMSWYVAGPSALPAPLHGKGQHFLIEKAPTDSAEPGGAWRGEPLAAAATIDLPQPTPLPPADDLPPGSGGACADDGSDCRPADSAPHP